jgi:hypothetical protein
LRPTGIGRSQLRAARVAIHEPLSSGPQMCGNGIPALQWLSGGNRWHRRLEGESPASVPWLPVRIMPVYLKLEELYAASRPIRGHLSRAFRPLADPGHPRGPDASSGRNPPRGAGRAKGAADEIAQAIRYARQRAIADAQDYCIAFRIVGVSANTRSRERGPVDALVNKRRHRLPARDTHG